MQTASVLAFTRWRRTSSSSAPHPGAPGRAEGHQRGRGQAQLGRGPGEELLVLGVGAGPSALDEGHAEVVELLGHPQLVVDGERQPLLLRAVAQRGVEDVDGLGQDREVEAVARRAVVVVAPACRRRRLLDMLEPVLVAVDLAAHGGEVGLLDLLGDRARAGPSPTVRSSTSRIGTTSAAVPVRKASSAV